MFSALSYKKTIAIALTLAALSAKAQVPGSAIDVQHYTFALQLNDDNNNIKGEATVDIKFLKSTPSFSLNLVKKNNTGKGMTVSSITENGKPVKFEQDSDAVKIYTPIRAISRHSFVISYEGIPADGLIISTNNFGHRTFFGDNWPNRAHNWLPCVDAPVDKATVDFIVTAPDHYQVVSNGLKLEEKALPNRLKLTHWQENVALPTKVMVIGVAQFAIDYTGDVSGIPVYTYVFPESKDAGFKNYAVAKEILPFFIKKVGPYSYEKLANVQSKTIFGGMENASAIFYFEESVTSKGIEELMAHEIAHQWFGDGASEKSFAHLWLSEGFATYMTNLYLENKYGADTLKSRLIEDRKTVLDFEKKRFTPVVDTAVKDQYMQLLNANSYQKGGWVLHMLRRKLGDAIFWKGVSAYYTKYNGRNANTADLCLVMEQASGQNLKPFFKQWLRVAGHPDVDITWQYDAARQTVSFSVDQKQSYLYEFPLEMLVDGKLHTIEVKNKTATVQFASKTKPLAVIADPNVNLLATFSTIAK
ncbi:M1 family metallopeptidase [Mucilaginibacter sp. FT3.2]|uniref:M1 family metallopeptidase n=1 Tax=Mucilaginibacter sp. FT3.2 TaxID=2723090 RepID=UPI0016164869|nr:M1 family metallopeptidase [Mucilaginibacter sp. FT3.2]MBB6234657.1 aminopeptidase N [Mucilaginibacter sp. FT3.2]